MHKPCPVILEPEELHLHDPDLERQGGTKPVSQNKEEVFTPSGQRLVNIKTVKPRTPRKVDPSMAPTKAAKTYGLSAHDWADILQTLEQELRAQPWAQTGAYLGAFWHFDIKTMALRLEHKRIKIPPDLLLLGAPVAALLEIALSILVRTLRPRDLRPMAIMDIFKQQNVNQLTMLLVRGEEFCRNLIRLLDDARVVEHRIPGVTQEWCTIDGRLAIPDSLAQTVELTWKMQRNGRGLFLAAFDEMFEGNVVTNRPSLPYVLAVCIRLLLTEQMTHGNRLALANEGWKVNLLLAWGLPGGCYVPDKVRYGWRAPDRPHLPGYRLIAMSDGGQLVYQNKKTGQRMAEGLTMTIDPRVQAWGWNVRVTIDASNAAYLAAFKQPPQACPWSWYEAWGSGLYKRNGLSRDGQMKTRWLEDLT